MLKRSRDAGGIAGLDNQGQLARLGKLWVDEAWSRRSRGSSTLGARFSFEGKCNAADGPLTLKFVVDFGVSQCRFYQSGAEPLARRGRHRRAADAEN